jgi:hypothetical protein
MRRHVALAATLVTLALAACSDNQRPAPTEPDFDKGVPCPTTSFPLSSVNTQITALYPAGTLRTNALAKAQDISKKWSQCKVADPQEKVVAFINQLLADFKANKLIGGQTDATALKVATLINTMLAGVNLAPNFPTTPSSDLDFGAGWFIPGQPLLVRSSLGDGGVFLPPNAFTVPTAVTILRLPPSANPFGDEPVSPPFFDITASNSLGTHYLANGAKAIVGFCVDEEILNSLNEPAIAHIAATELPLHAGGFELLDPATAAQYNSLGLTDCAQLPTSIGSLLHGGWPELKSYASATFQSLLLPDALAAATVGKGGLGGLASSMSPFGIADREPSSNELRFSEGDDPLSYYFKGGQLDTCRDGCPIRVEIFDSEGTLNSGTVTVSLITVHGSGTLSGTLSQEISEGSAAFDDLSISQPGTYKLQFTAPGAQTLTSPEIQIYDLAFQTQPTAAPNDVVNEFDFLGQTVAGFTNPAVQVKIIDYTGATVTSATDMVSMSISQGTLNGTTSVNAVNGVATFAQSDDSEGGQLGLYVTTDGVNLTGVTLQAAVFDEPAVSSAPFAVDAASE